MNWDQIQTQWKQLKGQARQQWSQLTEEDLQRISGNRDKLITGLQERYGMPKQEAESQADNWARNLHAAEPTRSGRAGAV